MFFVLWGFIGFLFCFVFMWFLDKRGEGVWGVLVSVVVFGGMEFVWCLGLWVVFFVFVFGIV